jgi:hypothetical protein
MYEFTLKYFSEFLGINLEISDYTYQQMSDLKSTYGEKVFNSEKISKLEIFER